MKKRIFIFCTVLSISCLTLFAFKKASPVVTVQKKATCNQPLVFDNDFVNHIFIQAGPDLIYKVESRFRTTVTKENLIKAKSIRDILPKEATQSIESFNNVKVAVLHDGKESIEKGKSEGLNSAQIKLLQSTDYSTNIYIAADHKRKNDISGELEDDHLVYYMTIVPEKEAEYTNGHGALIEYLKENSKEKSVIIKQDQLKPGRVNFTVTKEGIIANVKLSSTSGYDSVDENLVEIIGHMPGKWEPATNSKGEKVDQELIFFFGLEGC